MRAALSNIRNIGTTVVDKAKNTMGKLPPFVGKQPQSPTSNPSVPQPEQQPALATFPVETDDVMEKISQLDTLKEELKQIRKKYNEGEYDEARVKTLSTQISTFQSEIDAFLQKTRTKLQQTAEKTFNDLKQDDRKKAVLFQFDKSDTTTKGNRGSDYERIKNQIQVIANKAKNENINISEEYTKYNTLIDEYNRLFASKSSSAQQQGGKKKRMRRIKGGQAADATASSSASTADATGTDAKVTNIEVTPLAFNERSVSTSTQLNAPNPVVNSTNGVDGLVNIPNSFTAGTMINSNKVPDDIVNIVTPRLGGGGKKKKSRAAGKKA
jgi:hypothetical protein